MFNRLSLWWICLYPASFRERYEQEMLQLFRDRMRDEAGVWAKIRFQFDLLYDLAIALPQVYSHIRKNSERPDLANTGFPRFRVIDEKGPSLWIYAASTVASMVVLHLIRNLHPCVEASASVAPLAFERFSKLLYELLKFAIQI